MCTFSGKGEEKRVVVFYLLCDSSTTFSKCNMSCVALLHIEYYKKSFYEKLEIQHPLLPAGFAPDRKDMPTN